MAIFKADVISTSRRSTGICWMISQDETTSFAFKTLFFIIAIKALPISKGNIPGATKSQPSVSRTIESFSGSFRATEINVFVSATTFMSTIVRIHILFVKINDTPQRCGFLATKR